MAEKLHITRLWQTARLPKVVAGVQSTDRCRCTPAYPLHNRTYPGNLLRDPTLTSNFAQPAQRSAVETDAQSQHGHAASSAQVQDIARACCDARLLHIRL